MAVLYLGQRVACGGFTRKVVLKRLLPELSQNPEAEALFLREACLGASLEHPAIVRVLDLTEIDRVLYLVMEYVHGGDLRRVLRRARWRNQWFSPAAALYIGRELCAALEYAHSRCLPDGRSLGLIHRDISPSNILLSVEGEVKLTDFGIAQADLLSDAKHGNGPRARGQVGYMSPEQARGAELDARSDLFSLAAVLYEVCTGRRLFVGQVEQRLSEVYGLAIEPPSRIRNGLPVELDAVLLETLALSAPDRPASAQVLHDKLREIARRCQLWMDRTEFAAHLSELCGPDPAEWARLDERTATALIASVPAEEVSDNDDPSESLLGEELPRDTLPSSGLIAQASAMAAEDEPSEPAITMPWPTVPHSQPPNHESDDTQPMPAGPVADEPPLRTDTILIVDEAHRLDLDAVTGPAERTAPTEKLSEHSTVQHVAMHRRAILRLLPWLPNLCGGWLERERLIGLVAGVFVGLLVNLLLFKLLSLSR